MHKKNPMNTVALPSWCKPCAGGCLLAVHVQPNAKTTAAAGEHDGALKIRLAAPPLDGRANAALMDWVARACGLAKRDVTLKSGDASRRKLLVLAGIDAADAAQRLLAA